jgi:hyperosmotically inducible protein
MDDQLRRRVYYAIFRDPMLSRYALNPLPPIHIIVKNGHVTLEGVVHSQAEKNVANIRANGIPGIFSVTNHLNVEK